MGPVKREVMQASPSNAAERVGPVLSSTPGHVRSSQGRPPAAVPPPRDRAGRAGDWGRRFCPVTSGRPRLLRTCVSETPAAGCDPWDPDALVSDPALKHLRWLLLGFSWENDVWLVGAVHRGRGSQGPACGDPTVALDAWTCQIGAAFLEQLRPGPEWTLCAEWTHVWSFQGASGKSVEAHGLRDGQVVPRGNRLVLERCHGHTATFLCRRAWPGWHRGIWSLKLVFWV